MAEGVNLFGDGVNIAARLEALAPEGGVCISAPVAAQVRGKVDGAFAAAGAQRLKIIPEPVKVRVRPADAARALNDEQAEAEALAANFRAVPSEGGGPAGPVPRSPDAR